MITYKKEDFFDLRNNFLRYSKVDSVLLYGQRKNNPKASIMIPTYMRNIHLINTIQSALNQEGFGDYEIVVVDNNDNFEDKDTLQIVSQFDSETVCYYKNCINIGMFGNWNRCLELARGGWVLILHDDDTIEPEYLSHMMKLVEKNQNLACIGSGLEYIDELGAKLSLKKGNVISKFLNKHLQRDFGLEKNDFFYTHPINIMGLFLNREKAMACGGFNEDLFPNGDYLFILHLANKYQIACTDKKMLNYRIAENESMKPQTIIKRLTMDYFTLLFLFDRNHRLKSKRNEEYIKYAILNSERISEHEWIPKLNDSDRLIVKEAFEEINEYGGIHSLSSLKYMKYHFFHKAYRFWIRFVRKVL